MQLRKELEALPSRMADLPVDERGYPVPWFVDWVDGKPEFRAMSRDKWLRAVRIKLCWVCGGRLGRFMTFVAGAMCGINRTSSEPPSHLECAQWSARNCPFLNNPETVRRVDEKIGLDGKSIGGIALLRNPGVTMLWTTRDYSPFPDGKGGMLLHMGEPTAVEWWANGRAATPNEVTISIETGLPALVALAKLQLGGLKHLDDAIDRFSKWLPTTESREGLSDE